MTRSAMPKPFAGLSKIKSITDKTDIYKTTNDFTARKDSRKEQYGLLQAF